MRRSGFLGILFFGLVALVAGLVGYQLGLASHAVALGATVVVVSGFLGFGFLLFLGFALIVLSGRQRGPGAPWAATARGQAAWDLAVPAVSVVPLADPIHAASGSLTSIAVSTRTTRPRTPPVHRGCPSEAGSPAP